MRSPAGLRLVIAAVCAPFLSAAAPGADTGFSVSQSVAVALSGGPGVMELEEDSRITPELRSKMWGTDRDPAVSYSPPLLNARVRLTDKGGTVVSVRQLGAPLAEIGAAPFRSAGPPVFEITADLTSGASRYAGSTTTLVVPSSDTLDPLEYHGRGLLKKEPIVLAATPSASWKIQASADASGDQINQVRCDPAMVGDPAEFTMTYATYRLENGTWNGYFRWIQGCRSFSAFPDASKFP